MPSATLADLDLGGVALGHLGPELERVVVHQPEHPRDAPNAIPLRDVTPRHDVRRIALRARGGGRRDRRRRSRPSRRLRRGRATGVGRLRRRRSTAGGDGRGARTVVSRSACSAIAKSAARSGRCSPARGRSAAPPHTATCDVSSVSSNLRILRTDERRLRSRTAACRGPAFPSRSRPPACAGGRPAPSHVELAAGTSLSPSFASDSCSADCFWFRPAGSRSGGAAPAARRGRTRSPMSL